MIQYRLLHWDSILDQIQILIFNRTISLSGKTAFFFFFNSGREIGESPNIPSGTSDSVQIIIWGFNLIF